MNAAQLSTGDPNVEADWQHVGFFSGGKAIFYDLQPGTVILLAHDRVRPSTAENSARLR